MVLLLTNKSLCLWNIPLNCFSSFISLLLFLILCHNLPVCSTILSSSYSRSRYHHFLITFVPTISLLFYHHYFHYLICFWVVKQINNEEAGTCSWVVNLNDQLSWFSFPFCVSALNSPQKLRSSHWWLSTSMWWVRLFFECTSYHSTSRCQILQGNRRINRRT